MATQDSGLKRLVRVSLGTVRFGFAKVTVLMVLIVGFLFTLVILRDVRQDTTPITNAAFAALASLAALSFGCARAVEETARDRFAYAGERALHSALMVLMASILKYAVIAVRDWPKTAALMNVALENVMGFVAGLLFFQATFSAHTAIKILHDTLFARTARHPDWDDIL
jgi:hypothetical protein